MPSHRSLRPLFHFKDSVDATTILTQGGAPLQDGEVDSLDHLCAGDLTVPLAGLAKHLAADRHRSLLRLYSFTSKTAALIPEEDRIDQLHGELQMFECHMNDIYQQKPC